MSNDPLSPRAGTAGLGGPLAAITVTTGDAAAWDRFATGVAGLRAMDDPSDAETRAAQERLWGWPAGAHAWRQRLYARTAADPTPVLRIVEVAASNPVIRPQMDPLLDGGLSVGFAVRDMPAMIDAGAKLGFTTTAGVTRLPMKRSDGSAYDALECHFRAPDEVYVLGVGRPPDLAQVGPIAAGANVGGPAYSAQVVNHADPTLAFFREVLDYELRRDVVFPSSGPAGGLAVAAGTMMRFVQAFARGATSGYLVFLDFADAGRGNPVRSRPPNRGVTGWTFPVRSLGEAQARCAARGLAPLGGPVRHAMAGIGPVVAFSVAMPNGFVIEMCEREAA